MERQELRVIARIQTDFPQKFGIPRQAGIVDSLQGKIVFEPDFRNPDALRGIEAYSHLWLIWDFSENHRQEWSPTVRPPRLGGNTRVGVFATRSPFRPNGLGLSCVRLLGIEQDTKAGSCLLVAGADLMNGTPIFDIKPYLPYSDAHPEARCSFAPDAGKMLQVKYERELETGVPEEQRETLRAVLAADPRPSYHRNPTRVYGMDFADLSLRFTVEGETLMVRDVRKREN